jgi:hypothetical protein
MLASAAAGPSSAAHSSIKRARSGTDDGKAVLQPSRHAQQSYKAGVPK